MVKKIMIVEDNELNLKLFTDLLRNHGFDVAAVKDGREVMAALKDFMPDMAVMDIQLPHISGLELIGLMKADEALRHIPVLAVTAYAGTGDADRIINAGAAAYLSKPVPVMKFLEAVQSTING
ncbi:two-component system response regulator [Sphingorhabdus lutea]|uniref:Two-component system response regulator n=1 Tax=Sphingorhabdus lutea TaxID=1913578 RepID=A0A1L3J9C1_9SPHN|nr:response regulator [Sphingorhabdus lutea]APG61727.1 two-component system response regulator [Sphingorhabdus lutea]